MKLYTIEAPLDSEETSLNRGNLMWKW